MSSDSEAPQRSSPSGSQGSKETERTRQDGAKRKAPNEVSHSGIVKKSKAETARGSAEQATNGVEGDDEWARFQREVLADVNAAPETQAGPSFPSDSVKKNPAQASRPRSEQTAYSSSATIEVEPQLKPAGGEEKVDQDDGQSEQDEEHQRRRLLQEEKEEIFSRLDAEQQQQEEAEERLSALKLRLERIKAAKAARAKVRKAAEPAHTDGSSKTG
ncbi:unnamed protein product [Parajaminaea phylloscopi]